MDQLNTLPIFLSRLGRRLRWRDGWMLVQHWLWAACLGAALLQLAGRVWPVERLWLWTLVPLAAWLAAAVGISLLRPLPPMRVARRLDAELGLKERLTTALEMEDWKTGRLEDWKTERSGDRFHRFPFFHASILPSFHPSNLPPFHPSLIALQYQDALTTAQAIDPRRALPLRWLRRPLLLAAALVIATLGLGLLPNPMDALLAERAAIAEVAEQQAAQIEQVRQQIESAPGLTPEERQELLRQLAELAQRLRANPGDRAEALAELSQVEEALRQKVDPQAGARQAAIERLAAQLQALSGDESGATADISAAAEALEKLAQGLAEMDAAQRESLAQALAQMAARAAQAGEGDLAQALAALAQAMQSGQSDAAAQAARSAGEALARAQSELADQAALRQALSQLQESRQALAQAGQSQGVAQGQGRGQGQGQGQGQSQSQGQGQPGGGGGTKADTLPPYTGQGQAARPQGAGQPAATGELDRQVYVPWERRQAGGQELSISGQDTGQGETEVREQKDPLPGAAGEALVPYHQVYYDYLDAANQTMEQSYIPPGLKDFVREYFSQLEP